MNRECQEVTWPGPCCQVCGLRFTFVQLDHTPEVSDLPQGFLNPKTSQSHIWDFRTLLLVDYRILFQKNIKCFSDNFSAKIEVSGWMKTNMTATSYHLRILSSKYGQTGNMKPLTANRSLSFEVKWPNHDLKVSIVWQQLHVTFESKIQWLYSHVINLAITLKACLNHL